MCLVRLDCRKGWQGSRSFLHGVNTQGMLGNTWAKLESRWVRRESSQEKKGCK